MEVATFAGGCFWCIQKAFDEVDGVTSTKVGYTGGKIENPTYEEVCSGATGHFEAVKVEFDPKKISFEELLTIFWKNIEPGNAKGQFCDMGSQYKPVIFYHNEDQRQQAEKSKQELQKKQDVVVEIKPASSFFDAEEYHQKYYKKSPLRYEMYAQNSGRKSLH